MANKMVFVNLPVADLEKSKAFFAALGYTFNPQFTNEQGAAMVIDDGHIYAMLLTKPFFKSFIPRTEVSDATKTTEVLTALSCESREEVNSLVDKAIAAGGTEHRPTEDQGWMFSRSFADLDGHIWEYVYMDMSQVPANPGASAPQQ